MIATYVILNSDHGKCITCLDCGRTTRNENDVRNRYCRYCREFHDGKEKVSPSPQFFAESPALDAFYDWT
jgi:hypothetical protein